jgi:hypothetical protein
MYGARKADFVKTMAQMCTAKPCVTYALQRLDTRLDRGLPDVQLSIVAVPATTYQVTNRVEITAPGT